MKALKAALKVVVGLSLGLGFAELVFRWRDDGAFPHLNLYVEDASLGVALAANAQTRVKLGKNPTTTVRTNGRGFRGADWPAPSPKEVLVVGDSQVFGLGVEETETFSAQLSTLRKVTVINAGVPTYGPLEYTTLVERLVKERKPSHVVYVLNVSNDLFELERPNGTRHRVWDGWAVRSETAPAALTNFPFREPLMNRSHLVYAARRFFAGTGDLSQEAASEGTWHDVVAASSSSKPLATDDAELKKTLEQRQALRTQLAQVQNELGSQMTDLISDRDEFADAAAKALPALREGDPRDIVRVQYMEGARDVEVTANQLYLASLGSIANEPKLLALAKAQNVKEIAQLIEQRRALRAQVGPAVGADDAHETTPLEAMLARTKKAADSVGAKLVVVALPLDVMVSADEWKKYGRPPLDMTPTKLLLDDIVSRAEAVGAIGLDPSDALRAAEPGAFLDQDLHLTPKGHRALAEALHGALDAAPKPKHPLTLPAGRSWPPTEDEWLQVDEVNVKGSSAAKCETREVREWFRMICRDIRDGDPKTELRTMSIEVLEGGHGDAVLQGRHTSRNVVLPILEGDTVRLRVNWEDHHRDLTITKPKGAPPTRAFTERTPHERMRRPNLTNLSDQGLPCPGQWCEIDWSNPLRPVSCPDGMVVGGALRRCAKACDATRPCDKGTCHPWPTGDFCGVP